MTVFERFTKAARAVAEGADREARALGSPTVEAEHLLLALAGSPATEAGRALAAAGLDHQGVLDALEAERERSLAAVGVDAHAFDLPTTAAAAARTTTRPRWGASAKLGLERSLRVALERGDRRIEPHHVLLGLLRAEAGTVPRALAAADVGREDLERGLSPPTAGTA
jgi:ATP-dependent Clp protease ATP-binding subunit ClpA